MRYHLLPIAMFALLLVAGCGGEEFQTTDMDAATNADGYTVYITVSPDNLNIQTGGAVAIAVQIIAPTGEGVDSAAIILTATMGSLTDTELTTDVDGFAVTTLTAPDTNGFGVVVATYKGIQAMISVDFWSSSTDTGE
jgi:hypothetical protein